MIPQTHYTRSGDVDLAYQVLGDGPRDLVMSLAGASHLDFMWELPEIAVYLERLATLGRLIIFDKRGVGLSDRTTEAASLEQRAADTVAIMDAVGCRDAVLLGSSDTGATALVTAALYPKRVAAVIANEVIAATRPDKTHPWGWNPLIANYIPVILQVGGWGNALAIRRLAPAVAKDKRQLEWWKRYETMSATPSAAARLYRSFFDIDLRAYLDRIQAPVLLVHDVNNIIVPTDAISWLAEHLPDAKLRITDGGEGAALSPGEPMLDEIEEFLTGTRSGAQADHQVRTLLVTDIVSSTMRLADMGDDSWQRVLATHRSAVRRSISRQNGLEIDTAGDGFLIAFELPSAALRCVQQVMAEATQAGLPIRAGLHAGEVVLRGQDLYGVAVHIAARVAALAGAGEVLITDTVRVLAAGTRLSAAPAGEHKLRGVSGTWALYRLLQPPGTTGNSTG